MNDSRNWKTLALFVALTALALFSYQRMKEQTSALQAEQQELQTCRQLATDIMRLRKLPRFAVMEADGMESIIERVELAGVEAGLPVSSLLRIQPQSAYRLGSSEYRIRPTRLELGQVTIEQAVTFAHHVIDESRGLTVRDLRVWNVRDDQNPQGPETWSAEMTLTQLVFSPTSAR